MRIRGISRGHSPPSHIHRVEGKMSVSTFVRTQKSLCNTIPEMNNANNTCQNENSVYLLNTYAPTTVAMTSNAATPNTL